MVSTGCDNLDKFLGEGIEKGIITTLFGPSGSGKTNFVLSVAVNIVKSGGKVCFIDTENGISTQRIKQMLPSSYDTALKDIVSMFPVDLNDQLSCIEKTKFLGISLIVVDSISLLYRLNLIEDASKANSLLSKQVGLLIEIAREKDIPVLIVNQVYSDFDKKDSVKIVGGDILKYSSKCLIELKSSNKVCLRKHRYLASGGELDFEIVNEGFKTYFRE